MGSSRAGEDDRDRSVSTEIEQDQAVVISIGKGEGLDHVSAIKFDVAIGAFGLIPCGVRAGLGSFDHVTSRSNGFCRPPATEYIDLVRVFVRHVEKHPETAQVYYALEAVNKGLETSLAKGMLIEAALFGICFSTEDKKEGTTAFLAKRVPVFQGR